MAPNNKYDNPPPIAASIDTSMDAHSEGGSTTSGEYVIGDDDSFDNTQISDDVLV